MKHIIAILPFIALLTASDAADPSAEFTALRSNYTERVAEVTQPIKEHYLHDLQQLKLHVTDPTLSATIDTEITALATETKTNVFFAGTRWKNPNGTVMEFKRTGVYEETAKDAAVTGTWAAHKKNRVTVTSNNAQSTFVASADGESLTCRDVVWKRLK